MFFQYFWIYWLFLSFYWRANFSPPYLLDMLIFIVSFRCKFMNTLYPGIATDGGKWKFHWNTHSLGGKPDGKLILP